MPVTLCGLAAERQTVENYYCQFQHGRVFTAISMLKLFIATHTLCWNWMYCLYGDLLDGFALLKTCPLTEGIHSDKCVCVCVCVFKWADEHYTIDSTKTCPVRIGFFCFQARLTVHLSLCFLCSYEAKPVRDGGLLSERLQKRPTGAVQPHTGISLSLYICRNYSETRWQCLNKW